MGVGSGGGDEMSGEGASRRLEVNVGLGKVCIASKQAITQR